MNEPRDLLTFRGNVPPPSADSTATARDALQRLIDDEYLRPRRHTTTGNGLTRRSWMAVAGASALAVTGMLVVPAIAFDRSPAQSPGGAVQEAGQSATAPASRGAVWYRSVEFSVRHSVPVGGERARGERPVERKQTMTGTRELWRSANGPGRSVQDWRQDPPGEAKRVDDETAAEPRIRVGYQDLTWSQLAELPTDARALDRVLTPLLRGGSPEPDGRPAPDRSKSAEQLRREMAAYDKAYQKWSEEQARLRPSATTKDELLLQVLTQLPVSPEVHRAAFDLLSAQPGATLAGTDRDRRGRAGTLLKVKTWDSAEDFTEYHVLAEPRTGRVLEHRVLALRDKDDHMIETYVGSGFVRKVGDQL